eukprot:CAMPEP_0183510956 /NCGR_PEP_ID=MMETSP0371-20130417/10608_1 /TAXON_ID=268820 /ORGANISM="Peridinium aciculiferum, Strain PAER-2" /LENGTH=58 /DNA_ID=CAMNT_0025707823 /DNA_START=68 /DNA_END=240 /DNA_ORIENTATION=+
MMSIQFEGQIALTQTCDTKTFPTQEMDAPSLQNADERRLCLLQMTIATHSLSGLGGLA